MSTSASLIGARLRRIDAPSPDLWAITLAAPEIRGTLLVSLQPGATGVGWADKRPHGLPATSFVQKLRKELEGGRLLALEEVGSRFELSISRSEQARRLAFDFAAKNVLLYADTTLIASANRPREREVTSAVVQANDPTAPRESVGERRVSFDVDLAELEERARSLLGDRSEALLALRKTALIRGLRATRKKLARKLAAISGDAARAADSPALRQRAQLLLSNLHAIARGATTVHLLDYTVDPPAYVDLELDPAQSPRGLAEAWFKRARRFEHGAAVAAQRLAASATEVIALDLLEKAIEASAGTDALDALAVRAERLGVKSELPDQVAAPKSKSREPARHVPYRTLIGSGERKILVGKGASDNDVLTRDHARPHDLWLHARDVAGAHVVVPLAKGEVCPQELLVDAAHVAAHFSDARGETAVDVSYTPRRYVRKPKGAAEGLVVLEREKVLRLQLEAVRLAKLLQNERQ